MFDKFEYTTLDVCQRSRDAKKMDMGGSAYDDPLYREMTPSCWSKRFPNREQVIQHHVDHIRIGGERALANLKYKLEIPYGDGDNEKLDIFGTDLPDDSPILIYIHGGYWHELSRQESRYFAESFCNDGIKTIIAGYDLCPKVTIAQIVKQIEKMAQYVFDYAANLNSKGVYMLGHSAGAHLTAKFLGDKESLQSMSNLGVMQGAFLVAGVYDLTNLLRTPENEFLRLTEAEAKRMSPLYDSFFHLRAHNIRLFIVVAEHDSRTFVQQSRNMYDKLMESCQVENVHFKIMNDRDHFDIMEILSERENYLKTLLLWDLGHHFYM